MNDRSRLTQLAVEAAAEFFDRRHGLVVRPYGAGLINDTFRVTESDRSGQSFLLQRINATVFRQPQAIVDNLRVLLDHAALRRSAGCRLHLPAMLRTRDGRDLHRDAGGGFWRAMEFIPETRTLQAIENPRQAQEAGRILGCFHAACSDLEPRRLQDALPGFHVTPGYLSEFDHLLAAGVASAPGAELRRCIGFVEARRAAVSVLEDAKAGGLLKLRVIHGDPKLDNMLFDRAGRRAVALIDLDTVKPGLWQYDLGDCLRSCCGRMPETPSAPALVRFDLATCRAVLRGYLSVARGCLSTQDFDYLYAAIRLIPFELGLRFLSDHLAGDRYFKVQARGQNLHRASAQFLLTRSIELQESALRDLVERCQRQAE